MFIQTSTVTSILNMMKAVTVVIVLGLAALVDSEPCKSVRGQECVRRDSVEGAEWTKKFAGGDYCFKMFGSSVRTHTDK